MGSPGRAPITVMSGRGSYLQYRVFPREQKKKKKKKGLARRGSPAQVKCDWPRI